jgi:pimeloyl-ACP methyl ester carboxylesterase
MARQELNPEATDLKFANHGNHSKAQMATTDLVVDKLKSISAPTLVIHGYEDPIFLPKHAEEISKAIPHIKLVII